MSEPFALTTRADLPCPFCGGRAELHKQLRDGHAPDAAEAYAYFYVCDSCACVGGWGKSETLALRMWSMRPAPVEKFCRGEGCPRADLCRRHMYAARAERPVYFEKSPMLVDGQCGEFASNGWLRSTHVIQCAGTHPPPQCAWQCEIELHRWEKRGDEWVWTDGVAHQVNAGHVMSRKDRIAKLPAGSYLTLGELIDDDERCPNTVDPADPKRCQLQGRHFRAGVPCYFANSPEMILSQHQYHAYPDPSKEPA